MIQGSLEFLKILVQRICCFLKPPNRDNHRKASYPRTQQRDLGARLRADLRLYDQGCCKNDVFAPSATQPTIHFNT